MRKEGPIYDLPIAIGLLAASGQVDPHSLEDTLFLGELALDGRVRPINGVLPMHCRAKTGVSRHFCPPRTRWKRHIVPDMEVYPAQMLGEIVRHLGGVEPIKRPKRATGRRCARDRAVRRARSPGYAVRPTPSAQPRSPRPEGTTF